jgi:hypothetical protein
MLLGAFFLIARMPNFSHQKITTSALTAPLYFLTQAVNYWTITKYIHFVKAEKFSSNRKIFKSKTYTCSSLGPTTNMGHVPWLYRKWNYEQCFSAGNEGRKSYTKQRVDIIIYIRGEFWPEFLFGRNFSNWLTKQRKPSATSTKDFFWKFS